MFFLIVGVDIPHFPEGFAGPVVGLGHQLGVGPVFLPDLNGRLARLDARPILLLLKTHSSDVIVESNFCGVKFNCLQLVKLKYCQ